MAGSFRRRLFAIAALTVLACGAAIVAVLLLSRITMEERTAHAHESVAREVERLQGTLDVVAPRTRSHEVQSSGELRSGYVDAANIGDGSQLVRDAVDAAAKADALVVLEKTDSDGAPVLVAAAPVRGGGSAFAIQRVVAGHETRGLRLVVLLLAALSFGLVVASLRTLRAVEKGVSSIRDSLSALAKNLKADVAHPALRELDEIATGVAALADELSRAQSERERLTRELGERERLAALGRVAAGIAHEVRNPLASMKLRADLARASGEATPSIARDLEDIASEISRLDRLVRDLLVVSGRRTGPHADVDLGELAQKRVSLLLPWAKEKNVHVACSGEARASIDPDSIARAVDNLLRNAVEASNDGATVDVAVKCDDESASIVVEDRGAGVPHDRKKELFEPFFTTKPEGTGLGLALARAVAVAHGGTLDYARKDDVTRFTITVAKNHVEPAST